MIRLYLLAFLIFSYTAGAMTPPDLTGVRSPTSTDLNIDRADDYSANSNSSYKGRNLNNAGTAESSQSSKSSSISRSIAKSTSKNQAQMENLESTAGEFVQKLEEDRIRKAKEHENLYNKAKDSYTQAYTDAKKINTENLGSEQDPYVQNAFKCKDLNNCDKGDSDPHAVPVCSNKEVLHWTGDKWQCLSQFKNPSSANCASDQWAKPINNGIACVDYIYLWDENGTEACQKSGKANILYSCMKKKTPTDKGVAVSESECKAKKPDGQKSCSYYGTWSTGSWSSCSKTCGSGTQSRSVTCSAIECTGSKPATSQECNTHRCPSSGGSSSSCSSKCLSKASSRDAYNKCMRDCNGSSGSGNTHCGAQGCGNNGGGRS
ncbi:MAG: hypothetical protein CFH44_00326 [Proteobacteria bacterium]|nr:MAG: hypothetical protein CFH44_00326 [Pseudomonadota bacterium]|tara:strand:+ start:193 stop:1320 length:1128 start_codon:yes stop_codon:yes gene_type:complete